MGGVWVSESELTTRLGRDEDEARLLLKRSAAVLVSTGTPRTDGDEESVGELAQLAEAADLRVVETVRLRRARDGEERAARLLESPEVLAEVVWAAASKRAEDEEAVVAVFDDELTPAQQAALERACQPRSRGEPRSKKAKAMARQFRELDPDYDKHQEKQDERRRKREGVVGETRFRVADRTAVVLDLFARRASSGEGQLQAALATTLYRMPRVSFLRGAVDDSQLGTNKAERRQTMERDRKVLRARVRRLRAKIKALSSHRARTRAGRARLGAPAVCLVGYFNSGKSSLFRALAATAPSLAGDATKTGVVVDDRPFATLDPRTRKIPLGPTKPDILLVDTVGFVAKLPAQVSAAFRATLEEVAAADLVVHVLDASAPPDRARTRAKVVDAELDDILRQQRSRRAKPPPRLVFYNKIDAMAPSDADALRAKAARRARKRSGRPADVVLGSCVTGEGLDDLRDAIANALDADLEPLQLVVPHAQAADCAALLADLRLRGRVLAQDVDDYATRISASAPPDLAAKFRPLWAGGGPASDAAAADSSTAGLSSS